jgi:PAS domain S-box-containing protein
VKKMQDTSDEYNIDNFITLLNFIADPAIIVDEKANFLLINNAFERVTGFKNDEWVGKPALQIDQLTPEDKALLKENLRKRFTGTSVAPYEIAFVDKTKGNKCFEINAKKISYKNQPSVLVLFRDITRRKGNEKKLKEYSASMEKLVDEKVKEIQENAQKLRIIFDSSPDAISVIEQDGHLMDFNDAALKLFGFSSRGEVKDTSSFVFIPTREQEKVALAMERLARTGSYKNQRYTLLTKEGKEFPAEVSASAIKDPLGKPIGFVTITKDISERKKLEDDLMESEEKFRAISTSAINAIILTDEEGKVAYWNPSAERIFGYTTQEVLGKELNKSVISPNSRERHKQLLKKLYQSKESLHIIVEFKALRKDKTEFPIELSATGLQLKGKNFVLGVVEDISLHKKMESALKQERDMLEKVTENIGAGLAIISKDYHILWANKLLKQAKGDDIENKFCFTVFNAIDHVCANCGVKKVFENSLVVNRHDYTFKSKDGEIKCSELIVTPIKDKNGHVVAALELAVDVTEQRRLENQLAEHTTQLKKLVEERTKQLKETQAKLVESERLAAIGELAAMVGHDLRNPLTGMKAATYYLKNKSKIEANPKTKEMLEMIDECIDQSNKIVSDLLEYSRTMLLDLTEVIPKAFIKHSLSLIKPPRGTKINLESDAQTSIKIDETKIHRVFLNIIKNAFDAMPNGGTLKINSQQTAGNWTVTFTDSGKGMSKETLSKLGNPLFTTKAKGMGFGIPICKRIVEAHGGRLLIDSTLGKGTTVTISIPTEPKQPVGNLELIVDESEKEKLPNINKKGSME